jgi:hypothetical protein
MFLFLQLKTSAHILPGSTLYNVLQIIPDIEKEVGILDSEQVYIGVNTIPPPPPYGLLPFKLRSNLDEVTTSLVALLTTISSTSCVQVDENCDAPAVCVGMLSTNCSSTSWMSVVHAS